MDWVCQAEVRYKWQAVVNRVTVCGLGLSGLG